MTSRNFLPTERDFDPWNGDLDAQCAWKNFGGLTLEEAHVKFRENPGCYQEDFMFMGGRAFAFYFPVIEDYLCSAPEAAEDDREAWILAQCLQNQFDGSRLKEVRHLVPRVLQLAAFVREHLDRFGIDENERFRTAQVWAMLERQVAAVAS